LKHHVEYDERILIAGCTDSQESVRIETAVVLGIGSVLLSCTDSQESVRIETTARGTV